LAYLGDIVAEGQALAERPPLDLRVNSLKADRGRVAKSLKRFATEAPDLSPLALRLPAGHGDARTPNVTSDEGYLKGWFEVQDLGSQLAASLTGAAAGEQVLDLCAGAGGKTLAMAAAMGNRGQVFAYDEDRTRLAPIYDRLKRNGVRNVQVRAPEPGALDDLIGRMDRVVLEAPCTGTGTWRRRPDTKWKLTPEQVAMRQEQQRAVLAEGARYVRPGGALVYITCSLLADENANQIVRFLSEHPEFTAETLALADAHVGGEGGLTLTPHRTGTDGFYIALLVKAG
jgi:16S rRNA (cytosine967-C5)-methyltransferase